ncbi:GNAT family N-acetyltransferase [Pedococcus sp. 2YAF34]
MNRAEATRLVLAHPFETLGLRRVSLEVHDFNPRARRTYDKSVSSRKGTA